MEENQLDFNQPLLSVRRFSSTASTAEVDSKRKIEKSSNVPPLPKYKSELKSGPIRNPGTVPFVWERSPGRPKYESKRQTRGFDQPPVVPKLPPGRALIVERPGLNKGSEGTVSSQSEARNRFLGCLNVEALDRHVTKEESPREEMKETEMSVLEDEDDETYVDALDILSRSESFFMNCSISGVSGLDGPDIKPSGTFSTDPQTRDFMMGRFLPAAKAMASEAPQHYIRKQPVQEQPREIKKMANVNKCRPLSECGAQNNMPHCSNCNGVEETVEEDEYDDMDNSSLNICGLLPRLCLQNSFCLLNPVPGMRKQVQAPIYSSRRTRVKCSDAAHFTETQDKDAVNKQRSIDAFKYKEANENHKELKSESIKNAGINESQRLNGSSLYKRLQGNGVSPCHAKTSRSVVNEEQGFLGIPEKSKDLNANSKGGKNFRELLANERKEWESAAAGSAVEKTLYIDTVHVTKPQVSDSSSSDIEGSIHSRRDDTLGGKGNEETAFINSSLQGIKHSYTMNEKLTVVHIIPDPADSSLLSSERSTPKAKISLKDDSRHDQDLIVISVKPAGPDTNGNGELDFDSQLGKRSSNLESFNGLICDPMKMAREKVDNNRKTDSECQLCPKSSDQESPNGSYSLRPLPPPLPKSPSESWLERTLPAVSSKHTSLRSSPNTHLYPSVQASKMQLPNLKWETMVKTSHVQQGHLRFSDELLAPIPEV